MSATVDSVVRTIPVAKPHVGTEEEAEVLAVLRSGWLSQGPKVQQFERAFAEYVGAKEAIAVSSCTTGLHMAIIAAGVQPGDEVICPSLSFIATANSIRYAGAEPVFVDIDPRTYNLDPEKVEEAITPKTRAILAVHQIGMPADMDELNEIGVRHGIAIIEDAACAIGSEYQGKLIGAPHSLMACFSFHPRKILTTGEGGMITTSDENLAARMRKLRQHAMTVSDLARHSSKKVVFESYEELGYNYRMTDLQAAVGLVQLRRLPEFLKRRRYLAQRYTSAFEGIAWIQTPHVPEDRKTNYQSYMLRLLPGAPISRNDAMQELMEAGIACRRGIMSSHSEAPYREQPNQRELSETNLAGEHTLILPLYHDMPEDDQDFVIERVCNLGSAQ